jgi:hypothetical protein
MPAPAFDIQLVYNQTEYPEPVTVVRDGEAVLSLHRLWILL